MTSDMKTPDAFYVDVYQTENEALFAGFLEDYFYKDFRERDGQHQVELVFSPRCNLGCTYCYVRKYYDTTFPDHLFDAERSIANAQKVLAWMRREGFVCDISIFSGELFAQQAGYDLMEMMLAFYMDTGSSLRPRCITVPTNFTFLLDDGMTVRVEDFILRFAALGMKLYLSASFDGKHMESNRPFVGDLDIPLQADRNDAYYDKVFAFIAGYGFGLHPMVYSGGIDRWQENFEWFQDMMAKHGVPWDNLYLLQIRNAEWTKDQNKACYDFVRYLLRYEYDHCGSLDAFLRHYCGTNNGGFNIGRNCFIQTDRGLSCALQTSLCIRVSDLTLFPCHRLMYEQHRLARLESNTGHGLAVRVENAPLGLAVYGCSFRQFPVCVNCPMRLFCVGGCLGSQYETNGTLFVPIRSVCQNTYWINKAILDEMTALGALDALVATLEPERKTAFEDMRRILCDEPTENL